jgi:hypothetical protein
MGGDGPRRRLTAGPRLREAYRTVIVRIVHFKHGQLNETMCGVEGEPFTTRWEDTTCKACKANYKPLYKTKGFAIVVMAVIFGVVGAGSCVGCVLLVL